MPAFTPYLTLERHGARAADLHHLHGRHPAAEIVSRCWTSRTTGRAAGRSADWRAPRRASSAKPFSPRCTRRCSCSGTRALSSPIFSASASAGRRKSAPPAARRGCSRSGGIGGTRSSGWSGARSCGGSTRSLFWWFTPVLAGMVLSVPLSVLTSRRNLGARARKLGLFLTPEETAPPPELVSLRVAFEN